MLELFDRFAHRYDLHTPPTHYQHDHKLVLELALERGLPCRLLDVGCGTGVLVEKAREVGIEAVGIDAAAGMVEMARQRLPDGLVRLERMQELSERGRYDLVTCLSWSIHYCRDLEELSDTLRRMHDALAPGGVLLLQVAHAANVLPEWNEDRELGPTGLVDDVVFRFRFRSSASEAGTLYADYAYRCGSENEECSETHTLAVADVFEVHRAMTNVGFEDIQLWDSWRREPFSTSASAFIFARRGSNDATTRKGLRNE